MHIVGWFQPHCTTHHTIYIAVMDLTMAHRVIPMFTPIISRVRAIELLWNVKSRRRLATTEAWRNIIERSRTLIDIWSKMSRDITHFKC